jgi:hypothetical protein
MRIELAYNPHCIYLQCISIRDKVQEQEQCKQFQVKVDLNLFFMLKLNMLFLFLEKSVNQLIGYAEREKKTSTR